MARSGVSSWPSSCWSGPRPTACAWLAREGLLAGITKTMLETALQTELSDHLGYEKAIRADPVRRTHITGRPPRRCTPIWDPVRTRCPGERAGSFEPIIVPKNTRRLGGFDEAIISLYTKGLTTGKIQAHLHDVYGADISRELVSKVTDAINDELAALRNRPLDRIYPVCFIDAIAVKSRDGGRWRTGRPPLLVIVRPCRQRFPIRRLTPTLRHGLRVGDARAISATYCSRLAVCGAGPGPTLACHRNAFTTMCVTGPPICSPPCRITSIFRSPLADLITCTPRVAALRRTLSRNRVPIFTKIAGDGTGWPRWRVRNVTTWPNTR